MRCRRVILNYAAGDLVSDLAIGRQSACRTLQCPLSHVYESWESNCHSVNCAITDVADEVDKCPRNRLVDSFPAGPWMGTRTCRNDLLDGKSA